MSKLVHGRYGEGRVRLVKVIRHADRHDIVEVEVSVQMDGIFSAAFVDGDNSRLLPGDTMKNTVYALAKDHPLDSIEQFGLDLSDHFVRKNPQIDRVAIRLEERDWQHVNFGGQAHPYAFTRSSSELRTSTVTRTVEAFTVHSGLKNLHILKTTKSKFVGFLRDEYTTLQDGNDLIIATNLTASWLYTRFDLDYAEARKTIRAALLKTFAEHESHSVQHTLYAMGQAALEAAPDVGDVHLVMPDIRTLPVDLAPFGQENGNEIYVSTSEPSGTIEGTVRR